MWVAVSSGMNRINFVCVAVLLGLLGPSSVIYAQSCAGASGHTLNVLVELYVSENCRRCPEAVTWLREILAKYDVRRGLVGIVFAPEGSLYASRQAELAARRESARRDQRRARLGLPVPVLTPQVLLQGRQREDWGMPAFDGALDGLTSESSRAVLNIEIEPDSSMTTSTRLRTHVRVQVDLKHPREKVGLFVAAAAPSVPPESPGSVPLYQVTEWYGPFPIGPDGTLAESLWLSHPAAGSSNGKGVVAFVQSLSSREVLQSVLRSACGS